MGPESRYEAGRRDARVPEGARQHKARGACKRREMRLLSAVHLEEYEMSVIRTETHRGLGLGCLATWRAFVGVRGLKMPFDIVLSGERPGAARRMTRKGPFLFVDGADMFI